MHKVLAEELNFGNGGFTGPATGIFANPNAGNAATNFEKLLSNIISVMTVVAGIWFMFILFIGAIGWLTAGGDKGAVETARKRIGNGLTGLVITVIAVFLVSLVGKFVGLDILNVSNFITQLSNSG